MQDATGGSYLHFDKLNNPPLDEMATALVGGDSTGIPTGTVAYINDTQFNVALTLWVDEGIDWSFIKTDEKGNPLEGVQFQLYECMDSVDGVAPSGHVHSLLATNDPGCCWDVNNPIRTAASEADGTVLFSGLVTGQYMLAETSTVTGYQLPMGQWLLTVDSVVGTVDIEGRGNPLPPAFKSVPGTDGLGNPITILKLPNYPKWTMPSAGGVGTILYTIGGIMLVGAAVILLIVFRKKKPKK